MTVELNGPAGRLEALLDLPAEEGGAGHPRAAVVFAHPHPQHGGTLHTKVLYQSAKALSRIGCVVLRFNFRGVGRSDGVFDEGRGESADFAAGLDFVRARYPEVPCWAAGFSFGAWIALSVGAVDDRVSALIGIAPVVERYDFEAVYRSSKPKFLIHAERDEFTPMKAMWQFYARLPEPKELVVIDAADHLFDGKVGEVAEAIEDLLRDFPGRTAEEDRT